MPTTLHSKRQLGLRLFVCLEALLAGFLGFFSSQLPAPLAAAVSIPFHWLSFGFMLFAVLGLLDILINDILDNRYNFRTALSGRNDGYLILSGMYGAVLLSAAKADQLTVFHIHTLLVALACVWVAVMDVRYRYLPKEPSSDFSHQSGSA